MPINFGLLNPEGTTKKPTVTMGGVIPPAPDHGPEYMQAMAAMQNARTERRKADWEISHGQKMEPGELQAQKDTSAYSQATTKGVLTQNQQKQLELTAQKQEFAYRQQDLKAYSDELAKSGNKKLALNAMGDSIASHNPEGYLNFQKSREDIQKLASEGNNQAIVKSGSIIHSIMTAANNNPDKALDMYKSQYDTIKRLDPNAPDPSSFKNGTEFTDHYVMPTLAEALPYQAIEEKKAEALYGDATYKAQMVRDARTQELQDVTQKYGANSPEAKAKAAEVQEANQGVDKGIYGEGITGAVNQAVSGTNPASLLDSGLNSIAKIGQDRDQLTQPVQSPGLNVPDGRVAVKDPNGNIGHIPAEQLNDAIKAGYSPLQPSQPVQQPTQQAPVQASTQASPPVSAPQQSAMPSPSDIENMQ